MCLSVFVQDLLGRIIMKKNICITLQYDGTRYSGWQRQGNTGNTIEGKLQNILHEMTRGQDIEIHGSGRTDAGVHAMRQVANFHIETDMTDEEIKAYMNRYLPDDIKILTARTVSDRFHARLNSKEKTYVYKIDNGDKADVFTGRYAWWFEDKLDINRMKALADMFTGEHDFMSFSDMKNNKKSTVRTIYDIKITQTNDIINIEFTGNGFLYHMVRKLTAALVQVGCAGMSIDEVLDILEKKDKQVFKLLAPAKGLALKEVRY